MKVFLPLAIVTVAQGVSAHYRFDTLIFGSKTFTKAVRRPAENAPVHNWNSSEITCNINTTNATEIVSVAAGSQIGFKLDDNKTIYHPGPVAIYLGKASKKVADWDGSGKRWFKIAEWGPTFRPFIFSSFGKSTFMTKIPADVPAGEYLVRAEQIALHIPGYPEFFVGCAQIRITGGGSAKISQVSIPGYASPKKDPGLSIDTLASANDIQGSWTSGISRESIVPELLGCDVS